MTDEGFDKLGFFTLALLYGCLGLGSLFATPILHKIGAQKSMMIGSMCDCMFVLASAIPAMNGELHKAEQTLWQSD